MKNNTKVVGTTNHLATIYKTNYTTTNTKHGERLKQADAIVLKNQLEEVLLPLISATLDIDITYTDKGYLLHIPNEVLGAIYVEMQLVSKPLDIDVVALDEEGQAKRAKRAASKDQAPSSKKQVAPPTTHPQ